MEDENGDENIEAYMRAHKGKRNYSSTNVQTAEAPQWSFLLLNT